MPLRRAFVRLWRLRRLYEKRYMTWLVAIGSRFYRLLLNAKRKKMGWINGERYGSA